LEPYLWHFSGRALTPVQVVVLDAKGVRDKCDADHELGYELLLRIDCVIEQRLHATRLQLIDIYQPKSNRPGRAKPPEKG
jgi:hypothetical protein